MASEPDGDQQREDSDAVRRAAQDSAGELAQMGIDPRAVGLEPTGPPAPSAADPPEDAAAPPPPGSPTPPGPVSPAPPGSGRVSGRATPATPATPGQPARGVAPLPARPDPPQHAGETANGHHPGLPAPPPGPSAATASAAPASGPPAPASGPPGAPPAVEPVLPGVEPVAPGVEPVLPGVEPVPPGVEPVAPGAEPVPPAAPATAAPPAQPGAVPPPPGPVVSSPPDPAAVPRPSSPAPPTSGPAATDAPPEAPHRGPTTYGRPRTAPDAAPTPHPYPPPDTPAPYPPPGAPATYPAPAASAEPGTDPADTTLSRPIGGAARPPAPTAEYLRPLSKLVLPPNLGPAAAARRLVRAVSLGLIEPGAAAAIEYERQLVARARLRRPEPRVIAFVAGKGGVGTTTTAAGVALTLATLRYDTTALVSARCGSSSLGERLVGQPAPPVPALVDDDQQHPLWVHDHLAVIDGSPWHTPTSREPLAQLLDRLRGRHPLTIVDVGNDLGEAAQAAIERADQVVLVTSASQDAVAAVQVALSRVHQADPFRLGTAVVALTCLNARQYRRTVGRLRTELGMQAPRTVPIGFDPWLATGDRIEPARMRAATRESYLQIAGLVVEPGTQEQWFAQPGGAQIPAVGNHRDPGAGRGREQKGRR